MQRSYLHIGCERNSESTLNSLNVLCPESKPAFGFDVIGNDYEGKKDIDEDKIMI